MSEARPSFAGRPDEIENPEKYENLSSPVL